MESKYPIAFIEFCNNNRNDNEYNFAEVECYL